MVQFFKVTMENTIKFNYLTVIEATGDIVDSDVKKLQRKIDDLYKKGVSPIVIDLSQVKFLNSHGLGLIVYYHTLMQKSKKKLVIRMSLDEESYINKLFESTHLKFVFNIEDNKGS